MAVTYTNCSIRSCFDWIAAYFEFARLPVLSWIRIKNRFDGALLILIFKTSLLNSDRHILSLLDSCEKIRLIVRFEMNSSDDFIDCQSILFAPIGNNKHWMSPIDPVINRLIPL
jgi:hypothetical protein